MLDSFIPEHTSFRITPCNLFRSRDEVNVYCAVPEDRNVPAFIQYPEWEFVTGSAEDWNMFPNLLEVDVQHTLNRDGYHRFSL